MPVGSLVKIEIGSPSGTGFVDWTNRCIFSRCRFDLSSNAMPGMFEVVVEDRTQNASFITGSTIRLTIDGVVMFGGYIRSVGRTFAFPVDDTSVIANVDSRLWVLRGVDYNILFDTRVLRNTADYTHKIPNINGATPDGTALRKMFTDYADMPTAFSPSKIKNVGHLLYIDTENLDADGIPIPFADASKTWPWRQQGTKLREQIAELAEINAALYWIDGEMRCWYIDIEDAVMPWGFSDVPNRNTIANSTDGFGAGANTPYSTIGFRDIDVIEDGGSITTDALIWGGKALTSGNILFARVQNKVDGTSQRTSQTYVQQGNPVGGSPLEVYGRWQRGEVHVAQDNYGTLTNVTLRAKHLVMGLTGVAGGEERGLSKPQWNITLTWFAHEVPTIGGVPYHVRPGYFTNFLLYTFGASKEQSGVTVRQPLWKTLPVRSISISFPNLDPTGAGYVEFTGHFGLQADDSFNFWRYVRNQGRVVAENPGMYALPVTDGSDSADYGASAEMRPYEAPDGERTDFSLQLANGTPAGYVGGSLSVYVGGIMQVKGTQLIELSPVDGTFRLTYPPATDQSVVARFTALAAAAGPSPAGHFDVSFLSRPAASRVGSSATAYQLYQGAHDVEISNKTFQNLGTGVEAIRFEGCTNVWVHDCDFRNVAQVITAWNTTNVTVEWNRYENILGPHERTGRNLANFIQLAEVSTALVANNKGKGGDTEDICSCYKTDHAIFEDNHFEGTNWTSTAGSGIALGDDGGAYNIARRNIVINPGQAGIFIAGGIYCQILDNIIMKPPGSLGGSGDVGIYVWNQYASPSYGHTVNGNRILWYKADGSQNPFWDAGNCGPIAGTNEEHAALNIEQYRVIL